jgi:hypothetical protein
LLDASFIYLNRSKIYINLIDIELLESIRLAWKKSNWLTLLWHPQLLSNLLTIIMANSPK